MRILLAERAQCRRDALDRLAAAAVYKLAPGIGQRNVDPTLVVLIGAAADPALLLKVLQKRRNARRRYPHAAPQPRGTAGRIVEQQQTQREKLAAAGVAYSLARREMAQPCPDRQHLFRKRKIVHCCLLAI